MSFRFYYDLLSQPSRALYIYFKLNKVPFVACPVALRKGEHLTDEFKEKLSRFQKVPFIHDGDFRLTESVAIVRYVARRTGLYSSWYPEPLEEQARVDEYLEWQHNNTRLFCATYFMFKILMPMLSGKEAPPELVNHAKVNMIKTLDVIENVWLKNSKFLCGDKISIADIFAACELEQPRIAGFNPAEGRPTLKEWWDRVKRETNPYYDEAHVMLNKMVNRTAPTATAKL